jgi:hypothetical protein
MFLTEQQILENGGIPISTRVLRQDTPNLGHQQCVGCRVVLPYSAFRRDTSRRNGRYPLCCACESIPKLSLEEHTYRVKEMNYFNREVRRQRWDHQTDYEDENSRLGGRWLHSSDVIHGLRQLNPHFFFIDGNVINNIAVYRIYGRKFPEFKNQDFRYLWYLPMGMMPEYSVYLFNERDIPVRERLRGWRTPLLRCITSELFTEEASKKVFGEPSGVASTVWKRTLYNWRNGRA